MALPLWASGQGIPNVSGKRPALRVWLSADVAGGGAKDGFDLEWSESWVFAQDFGYQAGDVRRRKAVARHSPLLTTQPGYSYIDSWCAELHGWRGIVIKLVGVLSLVARYRGDCCVQGGKARRRHIIRCRHQHD